MLRAVVLATLIVSATMFSLRQPLIRRNRVHRCSVPVLASAAADDENADDEQSRPKVLESVARAAAESLTEGNAAEIQFMITQNMRAKLADLGYTSAEVDAMEPSRAAAIIERGTPNSRQPQAKLKTSAIASTFSLRAILQAPTRTASAAAPRGHRHRHAPVQLDYLCQTQLDGTTSRWAGHGWRLPCVAS